MAPFDESGPGIQAGAAAWPRSRRRQSPRHRPLVGSRDPAVEAEAEDVGRGTLAPRDLLGGWRIGRNPAADPIDSGREEKGAAEARRIHAGTLGRERMRARTAAARAVTASVDAADPPRDTPACNIQAEVSAVSPFGFAGVPVHSEVWGAVGPPLLLAHSGSGPARGGSASRPSWTVAAASRPTCSATAGPAGRRASPSRTTPRPTCSPR
jgi:hypothetical protein